MEKLIQEAHDLFGISLKERQVAALTVYERELLAWNKKFNLTAIRDEEGVRTKHFLDSFSCVLAWKKKTPGHMIDVGSGAGFPGLPLKILYPGLRLTLVESVGKKVNFCRHIVEKLELEGVDVIQGRAEELGQHPDHREKYDWAVARAVANLPVLAEYLLPLVQVGGTMLAQKGDTVAKELQAAEKALQALGGSLHQVIAVTLPGVAEEHCLILIDKVAPTPSQYPRKPGTPTKKPL